MARKRTRFTISVDGRQRQLLSIGEGADGGLNLLPNRGQASDHPSGQEMETNAFKVSVHPSPLSDGFTIKQALSFANGDLEERALFIKWAADGLVAPIYSQLCRSLEPQRYVCKSRAKDDVINIGSYSPNTSTLMCFPYVMNAADPFDYKGPFRFHVADFTLFRIIFFQAYIGGPSMRSGSMVGLHTSQPRWNRAPVDKDNRLTFEGFKQCEIDVALIESATLLRPKYIRHVRRYMGQAFAHYAEVHLKRFSSKPAEEYV